MDWSLSLRPEGVVVMVVVRGRLATARAAVIGSRVTAVRRCRAAAAATTPAACAVVGRVLARASFPDTSAA